MRKNLYAIAAVFCASFIVADASAQPDTLFEIPDTICAGHMITPNVLVDDHQTSYQWRFCSPSLSLPPSGVNLGTTYPYHVYTPTDIAFGKDGNIFVGFVSNATEGLVRWVFREGIEGGPISINFGDMDGSLPNEAQGLELVMQDGVNHLFVIGGVAGGSSSLVRYTYGDGLRRDVTDTMNLGDLAGGLVNPRRLFIANDGGNWIGFTFNNGDELIRLDFGSDITNTPTTTNLGNVGGVFDNVSSITGIKEGNNWHLHITDIGTTGNGLIKLTFGSSLTNMPFAVDYDRLGGQMNYPTGIAIIPNCREYYGYVVNNIGSHLNTLYWDESVADTPTAVNNGNIGGMVQPTAMSQFLSDSGTLYLFVTNSDNSVTRLKYEACGSASYPGSNERIPEPFTYTTPGNYTVFFSVNMGTPNERHYCKNITVVAPPDIVYSNDTLICQGDTISIHALYTEPVPISWQPDYNISSLDQQVVNVWPQKSTGYVSTINFRDNCILSRNIQVDVSKIAADAGEDRDVSDGSSVVLGGPMTTTGPEYTYNWFPADYLTGSSSRNITTAKPGQSITYYLEVTNIDGCYLIDSVNITVNCSEVTLPNAFVPGSKYGKTAVFGLMNQRFEKINHFRIFDRWGKIVFETSNKGQYWDGTFNGKDAPMGVYVWEVDAFCIEGNRIRQTGNVTLIR